MRDVDNANSKHEGGGINLKKDDLILPHVLGVDEVLERYVQALMTYIELVNRPVPNEEFRTYLRSVDPELLGQVDLIQLLEVHDEEILRARRQGPRKRGRPKGSKNKPKAELTATAMTAPEMSTAAADAAQASGTGAAAAATEAAQAAAPMSKPFCMTTDVDDEGYQPCCPNGRWLAHLDRRTVTAQGNVFLYFTECAGGGKWRLKAYAKRGYRPFKGTINTLTDIAVGGKMLVWSVRGTTGTPQLLDVEPVAADTGGPTAPEA